MSKQTLITIEQADLDQITDRLAAIEAMLKSCDLTPKPEWVTINEAAKRLGRHPSTIRRHLASMEQKEVGGKILVRLPI